MTESLKTQRRAPAIVIQPTRGWASLQLRALWEYRELLYFLVWRDVKVRYKQTVLGVAWIVLQPVVSMVVFSVLFGSLLKVPSGGCALSHLCLRGAAALELFCLVADPVVDQPGRQRPPDHQGLLSAAGHPPLGCALRPGRFCALPSWC